MILTIFLWFCYNLDTRGLGMDRDICMYAILSLNVSWPQKTGKVTYVVNFFNHFLSMYKNFNVNFFENLYLFFSVIPNYKFRKVYYTDNSSLWRHRQKLFSEYVFISEKCFPIKLMAFNCHFHSLQNKWAFNTRDTIKMIDVNLQKSLKKEKAVSLLLLSCFYCF